MMTLFRTARLSTLLVSLLWLVGCAQAQDQLDLGTIDFPTSAEGEAQQAFLTGTLALHSFWYEEARDHFRRAREIDPAFAMAYWGEAMTHDHPLWEQHESVEGIAVLEALDEQGSVTSSPREGAYLQAVRTLFTGGEGINERRKAYADAMRDVAESYPDDVEAALFAALAEMSLPEFDLDEPEDVVPVAASLEEVYKAHPEHPGAIHYLIHVYDSDTFAPLGLRPANDYARTAPASSHALHMPSHIYRELEMWEKMAASNVDAYEASVAWQERTNRPLRMRDFHAFSWLFDAYMELERYEDAQSLLDDLQEVESEARNRGEGLGRIPSTRERLQRIFDARAR